MQTLRKSLSDIQAQSAEAQASEANLKFKVSSLEQQITLYEQTSGQLNNELAQHLERYAELRKSKTAEVAELHAALEEKTSEYDREAERYRALKTSHANVERKLNDTLAKYRELQSEHAEATRGFQDEIHGYKQVVEQHERMTTEMRVRVEEIEKEESNLRATLERREASLVSRAEAERERASAAYDKVEELETVIRKMQTGELPAAIRELSSAPGTPAPGGDSSLFLSPTASLVSKIQRGGRTITEVYADYVRLQRELQQEKQEKTRLEMTLNDIFNEIQDRVRPIYRLMIQPILIHSL